MTKDRALFTQEVVEEMFPNSDSENIKKYLPYVLDALEERNLDDREMILMALATISAETEGFVPISEFKSKYNTKTHPFDLYDNRKDLGNTGRPDGASFKGRGFIQLTGKYNYQRYGEILGIDLVSDPEKANEPEIAAALLAEFLLEKEDSIREALEARDLKRARRLVNGGFHGLIRFTSAFIIGHKLTL